MLQRLISSARRTTLNWGGRAAFAAAGYPEPELSADGFLVKAEANGFSTWVYGGTSINLFFLRLDLSAMYNFIGGGWGASANVRVQL